MQFAAGTNRELPSLGTWLLTASASRLVAVKSGSAVSAYSTDGKNWTAGTMVNSRTWTGIAYDGTYFLAVAAGVAFSRTADGATWAEPAVGENRTWYAIAGDRAGSGGFVVSSTDGSNRTAISTDHGTTYSFGTVTGAVGTFPGIAWGAARFIAVKNNTAIAVTSPTGVTWTARTLPSSTSWRNVAVGNSLAVAVSDTTAAAYSTDDGATWTASTIPFSASQYLVDHNGTTCVVVGVGTNQAATTTDGFTWTTRTLPVSATWTGLTHMGSMFCLAASDKLGTYISSDGATWT